MDFQEFPKIHRLSREVIISEKIDGTSGCIFIHPADEIGVEGLSPLDPQTIFQNKYALGFSEGLAIYAGSRTRWITPDEDNYGFAKWVQRNAAELFHLGKGRHFGEWWGNGIQRGYGLKEKRFSLFNTLRWVRNDVSVILKPKQEFAPLCCHIVPILYQGIFDTFQVNESLAYLQAKGSLAAPGFMRPEGVVVYHIAGNVGFKKTIEKDEIPKSLSK